MGAETGSEYDTELRNQAVTQLNENTPMKSRVESQKETYQKASLSIRNAHTEHRATNRSLSLPRTIGNQGVQRLLRVNTKEFKSSSSSPTSISASHDFSGRELHAKTSAMIQPKLEIGNDGDKYEQEADRAAQQVTDAPEITAVKGRAPNQPLPSQHQNFFGSRLGHDFSQVRLHTDERASEMADALSADAFTIGRDIYFSQGKLQPRTTNRLLAHELAHVKQQSIIGPALQPKLKFTGKSANVERAKKLLNSGLRQYRVNVDKSGNVTIAKAFVEGKPNAQQQALADRLKTVIDDSKDVLMTVSSGSDTVGGDWATGDFDIADLEVYGVGGLIHEIVEQHQKQAKGVKDFGTATTGAHGEATKAESEVTGLKRGADKIISMTPNTDGTFDAVIETPHTFPDGKVKTKVSTIKKSNIISVTWKP